MTPSEDPTTEIGEGVLRRLDANGTPYEVMEIDPGYADTASFCEQYGHSLDRSLNCILVASKTDPKQYAACLVQATRRLDVNHTVRRLMGVKRLSFASAEETIALTGMTPGGVTPFGLPADIPLYVDAPIMALGDVILGGGGRTTKIFTSAAGLAKLSNASVVEGLSIDPQN
jgi:prolyl-tRNA editing enzyme YbaK/EbsC (Cys-tRNA(Pro) deacylase)